MKQSYVYIITNPVKSVLYIGVTSNLVKRVYEHKNKIFKGFSTKYNCNSLVYYEVFYNICDAIAREKYLKGLKRYKKIDLIHKFNPLWEDLYQNIAFM